MPRALLVLAAVLVLPAAASAQAFTRSDFEADLEGWTGTSYVTLKQEPSGGNPGGRLFVDPNEGDVCYLFAPSKFLGNKAGYVGGSLSFSGMQVEGGGAPWSDPRDYGHVRLSGGGLTAEIDFVPGHPTSAWQTYTEPLTATRWGLSEASFLKLMSSLTEIRISVEDLFGNEKEAIDTVVMTSFYPPAHCALYNGNDVNPQDFACLSDPVVGSAWLAQIQTPPGTTATLIALSPAGFVAPYGNPLGAGELFVGVTPPTQFSVSFGVHTIPIPYSVTLMGAHVATQGARTFGVGGFQPLNGLLLTLGA